MHPLSASCSSSIEHFGGLLIASSRCLVSTNASVLLLTKLTNFTAQFELAEPPTDVISAVVYGPNDSMRLLVSSWDRYVYLYDTQAGPEGDQAGLLLRVEHRAPVLDVCFGQSDAVAYSAGLDCDVSQIDLETTRKTVISTHNEGVKAVAYSREHSLLISASWDCTLYIHVMQDDKVQGTPARVALPNKPYTVSLTTNKVIVAMAEREISIYELSALKQAAMEASTNSEITTIDAAPWQQRESSLKFMSRAISGMPDDDGYAISSIEGRVGVEWFDPSDESQSRKYAFKCHRTPEGDDTMLVHPVNTLAFHPVKTSMFASGGGDGTVVLWDGQGKRRIKHFPPYPHGVSSVAWNTSGTILAIGISPGFNDGTEQVESYQIKIFIRAVPESDTRGKS